LRPVKCLYHELVKIQMTKILNKKEAAELLKVSSKTIGRWVTARHIPFVKLPGRSIRFEEGALAKWIETRRVNSKAVGQ